MEQSVSHLKSLGDEFYLELAQSDDVSIILNTMGYDWLVL